MSDGNGEGRQPKRLLILGGTAEAAELARRVAGALGSRVDVITSLAGRLPSRPDLPGRLRVGGFGGAAGLAAYLAAERIDMRWSMRRIHSRRSSPATPARRARRPACPG